MFFENASYRTGTVEVAICWSGRRYFPHMVFLLYRSADGNICGCKFKLPREKSIIAADVFNKSTTYEEIVESQTVGVDAAARLALGADLPAHRDSSTTSTTPQAIPSVVAIQVPEELSGDGDQISNITQSISERPLILYAYSESKTARPNIEYFIRHGLHAAADFLFILNGGTNIARSIPKESNIRVIQRRNDCYDLGAYAEILTKGMFNQDVICAFLENFKNVCKQKTTHGFLNIHIYPQTARKLTSRSP